MQVRDIWTELGVNAKRTAELLAWVPIDKLLAAAAH
jgi:hypothetical protein